MFTASSTAHLARGTFGAVGLLSGIGLGSLTWFAVLSVAAHAARRRFGAQATRWIDAASGAGLAGLRGLIRRSASGRGVRLSWAGRADVIGIGDGGQGRARRFAAMLVGMDDIGVITVRDLRRRYGSAGGGGFDAVRGVTFSVRRGELFALLGTNGAGKTSTMEVLEGLAPPAQGTVWVLGRDPYRERALVRRRMGIMLQEGGFPSDLTVAETGRMWAGTLSAPRPVAEALEMVGLGHRAGVAVRSLSGGERRRLDLAMAILGRPEVLFLDEPTTGLDPESRRRTWLLIRDLLAAGTTIVLTTHYLEEAEELADRLAIMHQGRIVRTGTPAEVAASQPARISFQLPGDSREPVPDIAGTRVSVTGRSVLLQTQDLQRTLSALLGWASSRDLVLGALDARSTSLEEAFHAVAASSGEPVNVNHNAEDVAA